MNALDDLYRMRAEKEAQRNSDIGLVVEAVNRYQERNRVYASQPSQAPTWKPEATKDTCSKKSAEKRTKRLTRFDDGYALGFVIGLVLSCMTVAFLWWLL